MAYRVFFSFYWDDDAWRVSQVRNIGKLEADNPVSDNEWEQVKRAGDVAIKNWIDRQMAYKQCCVVLVGAQTASRKWVRYEIERSWNDNRGLVGIRINKLQNRLGNTSIAGPNPFDSFTLKSGQRLSSYVQLYDPIGWDSKTAYNDISDKIEKLVANAITARK